MRQCDRLLLVPSLKRRAACAHSLLRSHVTLVH
jgi:hypothetical protein